jgi:hypothetical protein
MFELEDNVAKDREKLGYEEFKEVVLENISKVITNRAHIEENYDFYISVIFKMYEMYKNDLYNPISISSCVKLFDVFLYSFFKYNPSGELPEDLV